MTGVVLSRYAEDAVQSEFWHRLSDECTHRQQKGCRSWQRGKQNTLSKGENARELETAASRAVGMSVAGAISKTYLKITLSPSITVILSGRWPNSTACALNPAEENRRRREEGVEVI